MLESKLGDKIVDKMLFESYPQIHPDEPMINTHFWAWLDVTRDKLNSVFTDNLLIYLALFGFDQTKHILSQEQLEAYKAIFNHYYWLQHHKSKEDK